MLSLWALGEVEGEVGNTSPIWVRGNILPSIDGIIHGDHLCWIRTSSVKTMQSGHSKHVSANPGESRNYFNDAGPVIPFTDDFGHGATMWSSSND